MSKLKEKLDEFSSICQENYLKILQILEDQYCWKCPQRSNRKKIFCQEVETWLRLNLALEDGIKNSIEEFSPENLDLIVVKYLEKNFSRLQRTIKYDEISIIKFKGKIEHLEDNKNFLMVKKNPLKVKINDLVLLPQSCPLSTYWFSRKKFIGAVPFELARVNDIFTENGVSYIRTSDDSTLPLVYVLGVVMRILDEDNPFLDYFK